jgi:hypothetical protein
VSKVSLGSLHHAINKAERYDFPLTHTLRACWCNLYASLKLLDRCRKLSNLSTFVARLRLDAALYEPVPGRRSGQRGKPRLKGERVPNLSEVAKVPPTLWRPIMVANWYGSEERTVAIASETAVWYSTGLFAVPVR